MWRDPSATTGPSFKVRVRRGDPPTANDRDEHVSQRHLCDMLKLKKTAFGAWPLVKRLADTVAVRAPFHAVIAKVKRTKRHVAARL
jgi:hypothetical protein